MLLRAILPDVLIDNFDVANFEKTESRFDIWLDEKKVMMREDKNKFTLNYKKGAPESHLQKKKHLQNLCKCLILSVDQLGLEPRTSRL